MCKKSVLCVCVSDCVCACAHTLCVCVCMCVYLCSNCDSPYSGFKKYCRCIISGIVCICEFLKYSPYHNDV